MKVLGYLFYVYCVSMCCVACRLAAAASPPVAFDVPAIVVAEPVNPAVVELPTMGGDLLRIRLPVSTLVDSRYEGRVREYVVEIESVQQSMRFLDFWPKIEVYSDIDGTVNVQSSSQKNSKFSFTASGAFEPFARAAANGDFQNTSKVQESFQRRPEMQVLSSSGTIHRGYGVFFKFRPGPLPQIEGERDLAMLAEVPRGWRADALRITMRAVGRRTTASRTMEDLGRSVFWIAVHREGDRAAADQARRFVRQERALRSLAEQSQRRVEARSLPTFWHKLGAALAVVDPKIPGNYLSQLIFSPGNHHFDQQTTRLPVELRVAVLDFWDERDALLALAHPQYGAGQYSAAQSTGPQVKRAQGSASQHVVAKPISTKRP